MYIKKKDFFRPSAKDFIFTVTTTGASEVFTLPMTGTVSFLVKWGDGNENTITSVADPNMAHTYTSIGSYDVTIRGFVTNFEVDNITPTKTQITNIKKWGSIGQTLMNFWGCTNLGLLSVTDTLDTTNMTTLRAFFEECTNVDIPNINDWNLTPITNTSRMFYNADAFNRDLNSWDVSNVIDMNTMFRHCAVFNGNVSNWDTSSVTNMSFMFRDAIAFNKDIGGWDVGNVTTFSDFLRGATVFNNGGFTSINNWVFTSDIGKTIDMGAMFMTAKAFNQPLSNWNTGRVTLMDSMFRDADAFNQNLNTSGIYWDVSKVTNFASMFQDTANFNGTLTGWDTGAATTMANMFQNAVSFNQTVDHFDVADVTTFLAMFYGASIYNQSMNSWVLKSTGTVNCQQMFRDAIAFNGDVSTWNTGRVNIMTEMFRNADNFNQNLNTSGATWDVSTVTAFNGMFQDTNTFNGTLTGWTTTAATTTSGMFQTATAFDQPTNHFDMNGVTNAGYMFADKNYSQPLNSWDTSTIVTFTAMFRGNSFNQDITGWTINTTPSANITMLSMFENADGFNQDIGSWNVTEVTNMQQMFSSNNTFNQDISGWNISKVTTFLDFNKTGVINTANYDLILKNWSLLTLQSNLTFTMTNTQYTDCVVYSGTTDGTLGSKLIDSTATFTEWVAVNQIVRKNSTSYAKVIAIDSDTQLSLENDIMVSGNAYTIEGSDAAKGRYKLLQTYNWTITDGGPSGTCDLVPNTFIGGVGATYITSPGDYDSLTSVTIGNIYSFQIDGNNNVSFHIPITYSVNNNFLSSQSSLTYFIDLGGKIPNIGLGVANSTNLKYFYSPTTVSTTNSEIFRDLSGLAHVHIENMTYDDNRYIFRNATSLKKLYLPNVTTIDKNAYNYDKYSTMSGLKRAYLANVTTFDNVFNRASYIESTSKMPFYLVGTGCKFYYHSNHGTADRNSFNYFTGGTNIDLGDIYYINGLTYTCVASASVDGEFTFTTQFATVQNLVDAINNDGRTGTYSKVSAFNFYPEMAIWVDAVGVGGDVVTASIDGGNTGSGAFGYATFKGGNDVHPFLMYVRDFRSATLVQCSTPITVNAPTSLSGSNQTATSVDLNFTAPTPNANGTDAYEVWVDDGTVYRYLFEYDEITTTGDTLDLTEVFNDVGSISGTKIKIRTIDGQMNFSDFSNEITLT